MSSSAFERASHVTAIGGGRYAVDVPDGWQQGRGAFGGLVLGALTRAVEKTVADPARRVRTLAGDLCGPTLPGPSEIAVRILRSGSSQTNALAELRQGGEVVAVATFVLRPARALDVATRGPTPPSPPAFSRLEPVGLGPPIGPVFALHYEYRNAGPVPFAGGDAPEASGWIREREPLAQVDAAAVVARLDAWWPALFSVQDALRPMATIQFTAELLVDPSGLDPRAPLFHRGRVEALQEGLFLEIRELWAEGALIAMNQQTIAILR